MICTDYLLTCIQMRRKIYAARAYRKEIDIALCSLIASHVITDMLSKLKIVLAYMNKSYGKNA